MYVRTAVASSILDRLYLLALSPMESPTQVGTEFARPLVLCFEKRSTRADVTPLILILCAAVAV